MARSGEPVAGVPARCGRTPFDPTHKLIGGTGLIRVGVARHASLASAVSRAWHGFPGDFAGMFVNVQVRRR